MTEAGRNHYEAMSSPKAYLLLLLGLFAVYLFIKPAITKILRQQQQITALSTQQQQAQQQQKSLAAQQHAVALSLKTMIKHGELSPYTQPAKIAENTQSVFKSAAQLAEASTQQLRPSKNNTNSMLVEHSLDVTYTISASKFGLLLTEIANSYPAPRITVLSLRTQQFGSSNSKNDQTLSGQLVLNQAALRTGSLSVDKQSNAIDEFKAIQSHDTETLLPAKLESLFNADLRARERSPSLEYYRLSAITINASQRSVLITDKVNGKSTRLAINDTIAGWHLSEIKPQSVILTKEDESTLLNLE